ncbi:hypothetical protein A3H65_02685 [Candidatus Giovannonibacteria bacterium RIFCSPLOWO2_02_FULL_45_14]|uniref:Bis(5'-nucleosyl)-tetraphosphatase [asymmetrical] n=3 Tax=Parcubacteria group TaxID=1794811 RepID=A0A0H4TG81_9BACT|nr:NUDIX hydrolase [uncultured Parcubacteria bacterium Rifle_16ft_4_minimus_37658]AKQ05682.1 NUDIX hydrolase [uncultured Parcubacteria bacterium Rifle_16ft_4_minimus_23641]OGF69925.1 MAG: hypothetical protein A3C75_01100 [Candidatus Giovannonibacteria bacterium RIFCSPHIGHO2_02_FULL_44_31]OGF76964.1 MAG: hypothetical protein A3E62_01340 [Candidatus Giovannonibacteria bacterium RIFCSPHIGHO2_12_FULL_44_29]OGF90465.1 MAG: hypothetical protein A3H65_02685 [Candidatus Giovannonibacteria bacterium RIF
MPVLRSAGIILFRETKEGRKYLILRASRKDDRPEFWDIPKGELDKGEKGIDAARREANEETGMDNFELNPDFKETVQYFTRREGKPVPKYVAVFLAEAKNDTVTLSWEHDAYEWLSLEEALKKLTTMKKAVQHADEFLTKSA